MSISNRLDEAMKAAKFESQSALSRASGVPQPTINRILKGPTKKGPETDTLMKLAAACNVTLDWLREGKGPRSRARDSLAEQMQEYEIRATAEPKFLRHWLNEEEAEFLAQYRSLTEKSRRLLRVAATGMKRDDVDVGAVDKS
ncbi:MAG: helix-turn-helix transcriptional regulator [Telluria sp.]